MSIGFSAVDLPPARPAVMARNGGESSLCRRCGAACLPGTGPAAPAAPKLPAITDSSFRCVTQMTHVRHYYVDNLAGNLAGTVHAAQSTTGEPYPVGSVLQLVPTEVMVKREKGFNAATHDWEFFELDVSADGIEDTHARICRGRQPIRRQLLRMSHQGSAAVGPDLRQQPRLRSHSADAGDDRCAGAHRPEMQEFRPAQRRRRRGARAARRLMKAGAAGAAKK